MRQDSLNSDDWMLPDDDETVALARAIEASLQDDLARKSRQLAYDLVQKSRQEQADRRLAMAMELDNDDGDDSDRQLAQAVDESQALYEADLQDCHEIALSQAMEQTIENTRAFRSKERHEGSWDCAFCTVRNAPYKPKCECCSRVPPPHVLVFREMPKHLRFGCEIEIFLPNGCHDGFTLESLAKQLNKMGPPSVKYMGYSHETTEFWKIVTDASLTGNNNLQDLAFELVSPVLKGEKGLHALRMIMENIRRLGIATNRTCSFHVHVDSVPGSTLGSLGALQRVAQCFLSLENAFDVLVSDIDRRANRNKFCRSNRLALGPRSNRQCFEDIAASQSLEDLVDLVNPNRDRYHKLNMTNLVHERRPSTCEFRNHGGVSDLLEAEAWVRLVVLFCQEATLSRDSMLLSETSSPKAELCALFDLVNCSGLEQFFALERRLFDDDRLTNIWDCEICLRNFTTSRSLAQHMTASRHGLSQVVDW
jgi:hypothetical protein